MVTNCALSHSLSPIAKQVSTTMNPSDFITAELDVDCLDLIDVFVYSANSHGASLLCKSKSRKKVLLFLSVSAAFFSCIPMVPFLWDNRKDGNLL